MVYFDVKELVRDSVLDTVISDEMVGLATLDLDSIDTSETKQTLQIKLQKKTKGTITFNMEFESWEAPKELINSAKSIVLMSNEELKEKLRFQ
jgi:hypothetical protein